MIFLDIIVAIIIGAMLAVITGLTPGIHINLVSLFVLSISPILLNYVSPLFLAAAIISMSIVHTFLDFLPSIYLGAPESETALATLPGHVLLLKGMGYEAIKLAAIGSLLCLIITVILFPFLIISVPFVFEKLQNYIGWILLGIIVFMIAREMDLRKILWSSFMFLSSGILGLIVFSTPNVKEPLFPLLSGLFGVSILLKSLSEKVVIPAQVISDVIKVSPKELIRSLFSGTFAGALLPIFPGLGPAQSAILGSQLMGKKASMYSFMILVAGTGTVSMLMSLVTLYTINKARNGSIVVVQEILKTVDLNQVILFASVALIAGGIATYMLMNLAKVFSNLITKVNYSKLCLGIIIFITLMVFYFSGPLGLLILFVSTMLGLVPAVVKVGRNHAMGVLLLPVILYFLL